MMHVVKRSDGKFVFGRDDGRTCPDRGEMFVHQTKGCRAMVFVREKSLKSVLMDILMSAWCWIRYRLMMGPRVVPSINLRLIGWEEDGVLRVPEEMQVVYRKLFDALKEE